MKNKGMLAAIFAIVVLFAVTVSLTVVIMQKEDNASTDSEPSTKTVLLPTYSSRSIQLEVPADYNVYYNGDPDLPEDITTLYNPNTISMAISSGDRPVTLSDINWQQLDIRMTSADIITEEFIQEERQTENQAVEAVTINDFSGYHAYPQVQPDMPSKADTGGETYYLTTTVDGSPWNVIITKQSVGDEAFETAVEEIINSITLKP